MANQELKDRTANEVENLLRLNMTKFEIQLILHPSPFPSPPREREYSSPQPLKGYVNSHFWLYLVGEMKTIIVRIKEEPNFLEVRAAGSILHDFYCGVEKIFERIAIAIDKNLPKGEDWYTELLSQMAKPLEQTRDRIISEGLM